MTWYVLLPLWFVMQIAAYLLAPMLPAFGEFRDGYLDNGNAKGIGWRLPKWLAYFDTPDNAITGDYGFRTSNPDSYWSMVKWLWRNPAVGFDAAVLCAELCPEDLVIYDGDPSVQDAPHGKEGYCFVQVDHFWNLVYVKKISATRCLKIDVGWQLKTFAEGHPLTSTARFAMSIRLPEFKTT